MFIFASRLFWLAHSEVWSAWSPLRIDCSIDYRGNTIDRIVDCRSAIMYSSKHFSTALLKYAEIKIVVRAIFTPRSNLCDLRNRDDIRNARDEKKAIVWRRFNGKEERAQGCISYRCGISSLNKRTRIAMKICESIQNLSKREGGRI